MEGKAVNLLAVIPPPSQREEEGQTVKWMGWKRRQLVSAEGSKGVDGKPFLYSLLQATLSSHVSNSSVAPQL